MFLLSLVLLPLLAVREALIVVSVDLHLFLVVVSVEFRMCDSEVHLHDEKVLFFRLAKQERISTATIVKNATFFQLPR
ncbi:hypothetical protein RJT34_08493 [Clitoria ternatea]|uniref:Secreted protein n=1 Tax=Clitoria ternatea TaxID=43366 RepID=A0AAN9PU45_CLITE